MNTRPLIHRNVPKTPAEPVKRGQPQSEQESQQAVYEIKVVLLETDPPIWRRFIVPSSVTLHRLHLIIQDVMGWTNSHLYSFQIDKGKYEEPDPYDKHSEPGFTNSRRTKLWQVVTNKGNAFKYEYDFGDGWKHRLLVKDIFEREPGKKYPVCLAGERACPPEDCGGTYGYVGLLEIIKNPYHEQHQDMITWLGSPFDPEAFDIDIVNRKLSAMRLR